MRRPDGRGAGGPPRPLLRPRPGDPGRVGTASATPSGADAAFPACRPASLPAPATSAGPSPPAGLAAGLAADDSHVRGGTERVADRRFLARALACDRTDVAPNGPEGRSAAGTPAGEPGPSPAVSTLVFAALVFAALAGDPVPAKDAVRLSADGPKAVKSRRAAPDTSPAATANPTPPPDHDALPERVSALGTTLS